VAAAAAGVFSANIVIFLFVIYSIRYEGSTPNIPNTEQQQPPLQENPEEIKQATKQNKKKQKQK
jgi:hypothetical protein